MEFFQDIFLKNEGNYEIYSLYEGTNGNVINSNIESFNVNYDSVELNKLYQNASFLKKISKKYNGNYIDASKFNYNFLDNFKITSNYKKYNYIFSALDIFINEFIYLFIIILISLEIYLRKRIGLL